MALCLRENRITMKALRIHNYGNASEMKVEEIEKPSISPNEVLVKVYASAINPLDWKIRNGDLKSLISVNFPLTLGWDFSGVVVERGKEVSEFNLGDKVYSRPEVSKNGSHAEYVAIKSEELALMPVNITFREAATLPIAGITAYQALYDMAGVKPNQKVLIHAGAGSLGCIAIQLAKIKGAYVITTASQKNHSFVTSLGADQVIDYQNEKFEDVLNELDVVLDTIGGKVQVDSYKVLKKGGVLIAVNTPADQNTAKQYDVKAEFLSIKPNKTILEQIKGLVESKQLKPVIGYEYSFDQILEAFELSETGKAKGKIIINM
jgi:NADPH:quinone reductase-like Zn-dependent oxidoreductase